MIFTEGMTLWKRLCGGRLFTILDATIILAPVLCIFRTQLVMAFL